MQLYLREGTHNKLQTLKIGTGIVIDSPEKWNTTLGRLESYSPADLRTNSLLGKIISLVEKSEHEARTTGEIPLQYVRGKVLNSPLLKRPKKHTPKTELTFFEVYEVFLQSYRTKDNERPRTWTIKNYKVTRRHLQHFETELGKPLTFQLWTAELYTKFGDFLNTTQNLANSTKWKICKELKTFLKWTHKQQYHNSAAYLEFVISKPEGDIFVLTRDEFTTIETAVCSGHIEHCRNLFLLQTYLGLRYSDLRNLTPGNFDMKNGVCQYNSVKTGTTVRIAITPPCRRLLAAKFPTLHFGVISMQKYGQYLKELGLQIGMTGEHKRRKERGNETEETTVQRYEMLSSHVARKTFVIETLRRGVTPKMIMKATGHKHLATFQRYVDFTDAETDESLNTAWE